MNLKGFIKDLFEAFLIVGIIALALFLVAGTWPALVAVESGSMIPNLNIGDVVFVTKRAELISYDRGMEIQYRSFGDYGDVIVFWPNGDRKAMPIIHRAIRYVEAGEPIKCLGERQINKIALHSGYITKGDNNYHCDQEYGMHPVKPDWIVGVAKFRIPYLGYPRLALSQLGKMLR